MNQKIDQSTIYADAFTYDQIHSGWAGGKDLDFYKNLVQKDQRVLEVACGTGRLTIPLAELGFQMTGLDLSESMLAEARKKAGEKINIKWINADCTNFDLRENFELIFMTGNSLQHLHTHQQVKSFFNCVKDHLTKGGLFAFDIFLPGMKFLIRDPSQVSPVMKYQNHQGQEVTLSETNTYDPITQVNSIKWIHSRASGEVIKTDILEMRQFFSQELNLLVESCGFTIDRRYGNWNLTPHQETDSKQILVLSKN